MHSRALYLAIYTNHHCELKLGWIEREKGVTPIKWAAAPKDCQYRCKLEYEKITIFASKINLFELKQESSKEKVLFDAQFWHY